MGVEFAHLLISRDNTFRPAPELVGRLIGRLRDEGYIPLPGSSAHRALGYEPTDEPASLHRWGFSLAHAHRQYVEPRSDLPVAQLESLPDYLLTWSIYDPEGSGVTYPLQGRPPECDAEDELCPYYDLQLLCADDFIDYNAGGLVDPLETRCVCGADLSKGPMEDDLFYAGRIAARCSRCKREFRPQDQVVNYVDPITGEPSPLRGGVCLRFAIRIQAGKGLNPVARIDGRLPRASPEFLGLCEQALGQKLYEVGYLY